MLTESQSVFKPMFSNSTETVLLKAKNEWPWNVDNVQSFKWCDIPGHLDHAILLGKLILYVFSSQSLTWFRSYLSDRKQRTFIDGAQSEFCNVTFVIP